MTPATMVTTRDSREVAPASDSGVARAPNSFDSGLWNGLISTPNRETAMVAVRPAATTTPGRTVPASAPPSPAATPMVIAMALIVGWWP